MPLLEIENLVVRYGSALVLDRVSLAIENDECVAVIGPNGAGKTTLLRSISALKDWEGKMSFQGHDLSGVTSSQTVALGIVQAPEGRHSVPPAFGARKPGAGRLFGQGQGGKGHQL